MTWQTIVSPGHYARRFLLLMAAVAQQLTGEAAAELGAHAALWGAPSHNLSVALSLLPLDARARTPRARAAPLQRRLRCGRSWAFRAAPLTSANRCWQWGVQAGGGAGAALRALRVDCSARALVTGAGVVTALRAAGCAGVRHLMPQRADADAADPEADVSAFTPERTKRLGCRAR